MNLVEHVSSAFAPIPDMDGLLVPTAMLYPSNGNVIVHVSGGDRECVVSDKGDALRNARSHGVDIPSVPSWLGRVVRGSSLHWTGDQIQSATMPLQEVFAGIALVARAASDAVRYAIEHYRRPEEAIYDRTEREMLFRFGPVNVSRHKSVVGKSNRQYEFDFAAPIGQKMLLLDVVVPNPASINAKAIAHIDVGSLGSETPFHALVYDDNADWNAADINLLQSAAQLLPISKVPQELQRYASLH